MKKVTAQDYTKNVSTSSRIADHLPMETPELRGKRRRRRRTRVSFLYNFIHTTTARQPPVELPPPPGVVHRNKGVPMKFKVDKDRQEHVHVSRRGSVDVDFGGLDSSERRKRNPPITSRRLLKKTSPKTLDRKAKNMLRRVFTKTHTPVKIQQQQKTNEDVHVLHVTPVPRVEHDFYPGEDKVRPSGGMLLRGTIPVDSLRDVTTPSDTARRRDELLKTRATIDELRAAIRRPENVQTPDSLTRSPAVIMNMSKKKKKKSDVKKKKKKRSTVKKNITKTPSTTTGRAISFVTAPSTSIPSWNTSPPLRPPSTTKPVKLTRPAETIHFTIASNENEEDENNIMEKKREESRNPYMNHETRVIATPKMISPQSRDTRRNAIVNLCEMLPESCNGRRLLAALRQEDSDRDGFVTLREIRLAVKRLIESPYDMKNNVLIALMNAFGRGDMGDLISIDDLSDSVDGLKFEEESVSAAAASTVSETISKTSSTARTTTTSSSSHVKTTNNENISSPFHNMNDSVLKNMPPLLAAAFHSKDMNLLSTALLNMKAEEAQYWMHFARQTGIWSLDENNENNHNDENKNEVDSASSSSSKQLMFSTPFQQQQQNQVVITSPQREREILLKISTKLATKSHSFREALRFYLGNPRSLDMTLEQFQDALKRMNIEISRQEFNSLTSRCRVSSTGHVGYTKLQALIASCESESSLSPTATTTTTMKQSSFSTPVATSSSGSSNTRILLPSGRRGRQSTKRDVAPWDK